MAADANVYRDATFSKETRDNLAQLARWAEARKFNVDLVAAAREVVERWDENDATEFVVED